MRIMTMAIFSLVLLAACTGERESVNLSTFCGGSTNQSCIYDSDCKIGGCSGQICEGIADNTVTTCEYRECYNAPAYNLRCGCNFGGCKWYK